MQVASIYKLNLIDSIPLLPMFMNVLKEEATVVARTVASITPTSGEQVARLATTEVTMAGKDQGSAGKRVPTQENVASQLEEPYRASQKRS